MKTNTCPPSSTRVVVESGDHRATAPASGLVPANVRFSRILVPTDFSDSSREALEFTFSIAQQFGSEVVLAHVIEPFVYPAEWVFPMPVSDDPESRKFFDEKLKELASKHAVKTTTLVRAGRAWREIVKIAREERCDLIVIATHGYTGVTHALLGSVAEQVVRHAACPVLTFRVPEYR